MSRRKKHKKFPSPEIGDKVRLRGRIPEGILQKINKENLWCRVDWTNIDGPTFCHYQELEKI